MSAPLITVILTVYQRLDYLREALSGVAAQSFDDYEVIVADDSGSEAAREIATTAFEGERLRYEPNPKTLGVALSLQSALSKARGRYITILNDDDLWEPEFLARLVPPLEASSRRVLAFCDHWIVRQNGEIDHRATEQNTEAYGRRAIRRWETSPTRIRSCSRKMRVPLAMGSVFRAGAFDYTKLVPEVAGAYDFWISSLLAASGGGFFYVPDRLTRYRLHSQMETVRRSPEKSECFVFIWRSLVESGKFPELLPYMRARLAESTVRAGRDRLYFNQLAEARTLFRDAFRMAPGLGAVRLLSALCSPDVDSKGGGSVRRVKVLYFCEGFTDIRFVVGLSEICDLTMVTPARQFRESGLADRIAESGARAERRHDRGRPAGLSGPLASLSAPAHSPLRRRALAGDGAGLAECDDHRQGDGSAGRHLSRHLARRVFPVPAAAWTDRTD